jgi:DNA-binding response OmpR family regulator
LVLVERRGETVSREAILEEVWGQSDEQGNGNVIEVYVRYLRRKLEEKGERRLIHTVRGMGYCLRSAPP